MNRYAEFRDLHNEVEAMMTARRHTDTEPLWTKALRGQTLRGFIATLESKNSVGRTSTFQVHYIAGNDKRSPTALTSGTFTARDRAALISDNGGTATGGRP